MYLNHKLCFEANNCLATIRFRMMWQKTIESYIFLAGIKIFMKLNMEKSLVTIYFESVDQDITNRKFFIDQNGQ